MNEFIQIVLILAAVIAGAICIAFSNQLMRKYPVSYLGSYFYYILFLYIFGVYSIIGSGTAGYYFELLGAEQEVALAIEQLLRILGIPFLILFNYMVIRIAYEIGNQAVPGRFTLVYFIFSLLIMAVYAWISIQVSRYHPDYFAIFRSWERIGFSIIVTGTHLFSFFRILSVSRSLTDQNERQANRIYGS